MLVEVLREQLVHHAAHRAFHFRVAKLGLGLPFELRLQHLHRQHGREAFTHVVAGQARFLVLFIERRLFLDILVDDRRQRTLEAGEVRAAFVRVDVVHEREHILGIAVVVLQRHLDADVVPGRVDVDHVLVQRLLVADQVRHELFQAATREEHFFARLAVLHFVGALVAQRDLNPLVQIGELAETAGEGDPLVAQRFLEDLPIGLEPYARARFLRRDGAHHLELRLRDATLEVHVMLLAVALDPHFELLGQRVHHRHANPVQTAGHLVRVLVELAAGVQHRHGKLNTRHLLDRVHVHGNATAVVFNGDGIVRVNDHVHAVGVAGQRFVDRVVHHFVHEVVKATRRRGPDVHAGALADRFEPLENGDAVCAVPVLGLFAAIRHEVGMSRRNELLRPVHWPANTTPQCSRSGLDKQLGRLIASHCQ